MEWTIFTLQHMKHKFGVDRLWHQVKIVKRLNSVNGIELDNWPTIKLISLLHYEVYQQESDDIDEGNNHSKIPNLCDLPFLYFCIGFVGFVGNYIGDS